MTARLASLGGLSSTPNPTTLDDLRRKAAIIGSVEPRFAAEAADLASPQPSMAQRILGLLDKPRELIFEGIVEPAVRAFGGLQGKADEDVRGFGDLWEINDDDGFIEKTMKRAVGFVGDTLTDPLTYVGSPAAIVGRDASRRTIFKALADKEGLGGLSDNLVREAEKRAKKLVGEGAEDRAFQFELERELQRLMQADASIDPRLRALGEKVYGTDGNRKVFAETLRDLTADERAFIKQSGGRAALGGIQIRRPFSAWGARKIADTGGEAFEAGAKGIGKVSSAELLPSSLTTKLTAPISRKAQNTAAGKWGRKTFLPRSMALEAGFSGELTATALRGARIWGQQLEAEFGDLERTLARSVGTSPEELAKIRQAFEDPNVAASLGADAHKAVVEVRAYMDKVRRALIAEGIDVSEMEDYFPRMLTPGARDVLDKKPQGRFAAVPSAAKTRKGDKALAEAPLDEANEFYKTFYDLETDFFEQDPFVALQKWNKEVLGKLTQKRIANDLRTMAIDSTGDTAIKASLYHIALREGLYGAANSTPNQVAARVAKDLNNSIRKDVNLSLEEKAEQLLADALERSQWKRTPQGLEHGGGPFFIPLDDDLRQLLETYPNTKEGLRDFLENLDVREKLLASPEEAIERQNPITDYLRQTPGSSTTRADYLISQPNAIEVSGPVAVAINASTNLGSLIGDELGYMRLTALRNRIRETGRIDRVPVLLTDGSGRVAWASADDALLWEALPGILRKPIQIRKVSKFGDGVVNLTVDAGKITGNRVKPEQLFDSKWVNHYRGPGEHFTKQVLDELDDVLARAGAGNLTPDEAVDELGAGWHKTADHSSTSIVHVGDNGRPDGTLIINWVDEAKTQPMSFYFAIEPDKRGSGMAFELVAKAVEEFQVDPVTLYKAGLNDTLLPDGATALFKALHYSARLEEALTRPVLSKIRSGPGITNVSPDLQKFLAVPQNDDVLSAVYGLAARRGRSIDAKLMRADRELINAVQAKNRGLAARTAQAEATQSKLVKLANVRSVELERSITLDTQAAAVGARRKLNQESLAQLKKELARYRKAKAPKDQVNDIGERIAGLEKDIKAADDELKRLSKSQSKIKTNLVKTEERFQKAQKAHNEALAKKSLSEKRVDELNERIRNLELGLGPDGKHWPLPDFPGLAAPEGYTRTSATIRAPMLAGRLLPEGIAKEINDVFRVPGRVEEMLEAFEQKYLRWFRKYVTIPFPGFHTRNALGAWINNHLGNVVFGDYTVAHDLIRASKHGFKPGEEAAQPLLRFGIQDTNAQLLAKLKAQGILGGSTVYNELERAAHAAKRAGKKTTGIGGGAKMLGQGYMDTMSELGATVENYARAGGFIGALRQGMDDIGARSFVMMRHGDYQELTSAEAVIRKFIPFYKWMRMNIPLQVETLATNPGKRRQLERFKDSFLTDHDDEEQYGEYVSGEARKRGTFFGGGLLEPLMKGAPSLVSLDTPLNDVEKVLTGPRDIASNILGESVLNTLVALVGRKDLRTERDIRRLTPVKGPVAYLGQLLDRIPGLNLTEVGRGGEVMLDSSFASVISALPTGRITRSIEALFDLDGDGWAATVSTLAGTKSDPLTTEDMERTIGVRSSELRDLAGELFRLGKGDVYTELINAVQSRTGGLTPLRATRG